MAVPLAVVELVIAGADPTIVTLKGPLPMPLLLVALNVTDEVPVADGVPEINPVLLLTDNPDGNPVAPKLVGELVAVI